MTGVDKPPILESSRTTYFDSLTENRHWKTERFRTNLSPKKEIQVAFNKRNFARSFYEGAMSTKAIQHCCRTLRKEAGMTYRLLGRKARKGGEGSDRQLRIHKT